VNDWTLHQGDCLTALPTLESESVQTCITSPPYFGLRDYGTATWEGGDPACDHKGSKLGRAANSKASNTRGGSKDTCHASHVYRDSCGRCGAKRIDRQIGLEATPDEYVAKLVTVFREVRRVLRDDGTLWLNVGDSYNNAGSSRNGEGLDGNRRGGATGADGELGYKKRDSRRAWRDIGIKHKDLIGIPWLLAFALRADGWYLRQDVIWSKPNPMPESVRDRCTKAHEYLFLLSKGPRYWCDMGAIAEPSATNDPRRPYTSQGAKDMDGREVWHSGKPRDGDEFSNRNKRSVWTIPTQPNPCPEKIHFAVMPEALATPCVLAGTSEKGCCPRCRAPWRRLVEVAGRVATTRADRQEIAERKQQQELKGVNSYQHGVAMEGSRGRTTRTVGWRPSCGCDAGEPVPCLVLDPFAGAGTVLKVAVRHGRRAVAVELNPAYGDLIRRRMAEVDAPLFADAATPPPAQASLFGEAS
jgi:DNA modification methylase